MPEKSFENFKNKQIFKHLLGKYNIINKEHIFFYLLFFQITKILNAEILKFHSKMN